MQVLAVGAMAVGAVARAFAFDKGARQHLAERTKAADEPAASFKIRVAGHSLSDSNNSVRITTSQELIKICKNASYGIFRGRR